MDAAGEHFLADAGFAMQQDGCIGFGGSVDIVEKGLHHGRNTEHFPRGVLLSGSALLQGTVCFQYAKTGPGQHLPDIAEQTLVQRRAYVIPHMPHMKKHKDAVRAAINGNACQQAG